MISIIIPVYNQAKKIKQCFESIEKQTYKDYEIIVVDDGSEDNPEKIIMKFSNIKFIKQKNQGAPSARNSGFRKSKGEYILFCDADAILNFKILEIMIQTFENNPLASYTYSSFMWGKKLFKVGEFSSSKLEQMPYIHTMSLIRREHFPENGWDESIKKLQDWDLWLTMLEDKKIGVWIDQVLFKVQTGGTISSWLPSFVYKLLPFLPNVRKYKNAVKIIKEKHKIT